MDQRRLLLRAVKSFHTFAWFSIEACMAYVLYTGIRGRTDRKTGAAAVVVAGETLIFAANGFHCPLTAVAQDLGDGLGAGLSNGKGSVTDIYLPHWFARNLPGIHVPLILAAVLLHWRNWRNHAVRDSQRRLLLGR
ncbi:hypothetical protein AB4Y72_03860 [Arthrobacter sp. YAF34]|uniref:hypothetical protein n=1 Tax=Arthrobacter sp. YAF34 TaxID=3233083 RepID=UPI003F9236FF